VTTTSNSRQVDPMRLKGDDINANRKRLIEASQEAINVLFDSVSNFPR